MIGDFNAKSCNWSTNDTTTPEGAQLDSSTSLNGANSHFATVFYLYKPYFH